MALKASQPRPTLAQSSADTSGFHRVTGNGLKPRVIVMAKSREKCGKTHFGLSGPAPVYLLSLDIGTEGVIEKFSGKEVYLAEYKVLVPDGQDERVVSDAATKVLAQFKRDYAAALKIANTVVVDTQDELWELVRLAHFGKIDQVLARYYGPANREMNEVVNLAFESDANVVFLTKMKDEYVGDKRTGKDKPSGWGNMPYSAQLVVNCNKAPGSQFSILIESCRQNPDIEGMEISNSLEDLLQVVYS